MKNVFLLLLICISTNILAQPITRELGISLGIDHSFLNADRTDFQIGAFINHSQSDMIEMKTLLFDYDLDNQTSGFTASYTFGMSWLGALGTDFTARFKSGSFSDVFVKPRLVLGMPLFCSVDLGVNIGLMTTKYNGFSIAARVNIALITKNIDKCRDCLLLR